VQSECNQRAIRVQSEAELSSSSFVTSSDLRNEPRSRPLAFSRRSRCRRLASSRMETTTMVASEAVASSTLSGT
jgi:hypothetical protein